MADQQHPYGHDFNDTRPGDQGNQQNLLHAMRGGVMGGNEYRVSNMPRAKAYRTQAVTVFTATVYAVAFDAAEYDTDGMWNAAQPTRLTVKTPGLYLINGQAEYNAAVNELCWTRIAVNGAVAASSLTQYGMGGGFSTHMMPTGFWKANAGDYFELWLLTQLNNTGVFTGQYTLYLQACLISTL